MQNLQKTGDMMLEATAYGDAAGLPVETWTAKDIQAKYGWLDRLVSTGVTTRSCR
jgi:ADP-ribosylglycohydrolase